MTRVDTDMVGLELHIPGFHHSLLVKQGQPQGGLDLPGTGAFRSLFRIAQQLIKVRVDTKPLCAFFLSKNCSQILAFSAARFFVYMTQPLGRPHSDKVAQTSTNYTYYLLLFLSGNILRACLPLGLTLPHLLIIMELPSEFTRSLLCFPKQ